MSDPHALTRRLWPLVHRLDWSATGFDHDKAHACSIVSALAYAHIPQWEVAKARRVSAIPCEQYRIALRNKLSVDIVPILADADLPDSFVVVTRFAIVLGVRTRKVVFIAIRGTHELYDWTVNLNARRVRFADAPPVFLHRGFLRAILPCLSPVSRHIATQPDLPPIYVTGHSLGGALAAIFHSTWHTQPVQCVTPDGTFASIAARTHDCYTYGMPRYGNLAAMAWMRPPHHLLNPGDIVPYVPPQWMGYENPSDEYLLDGGPPRAGSRPKLPFLRCLGWLGTGYGVRNHLIERYLARFV